jgi:hypothetical protein
LNAGRFSTIPPNWNNDTLTLYWILDQTGSKHDRFLLPEELHGRHTVRGEDPGRKRDKNDKDHCYIRTAMEWGCVLERPAYDLTVFKVRCGKLTLKIYTKGERVLRIEVVAQNTNELDCGRALEKNPMILARLKEILERFMNTLSWVDACFIADDALEQLPKPALVGKTKVGGIDINKPRIRAVLNAVLALSASPKGFTASDLALKVRAMNRRTMLDYASRQATYDLKKLRGKQFLRKLGGRRHEPIPEGLRAIAALTVLRDKVIQPLVAALSRPKARLRMETTTAIDKHYHVLRVGMRDLFEDLGLAA